MPAYDVAIVGGGPAGLSAAIYMARLNRKVILIEKGHGQTSWHQVAENFLGFPRGIPAKVLIARGTVQARRFGTTVRRGTVEKIRKVAGGFSLSGDVRCKARSVIFCTGVSPVYPSFPGRDTYIDRSLFDCLICHGYAVRGRNVVVVGHDDASLLTCLQLRRFTPKLVFLTNCDPESDKLSETARKRPKRCRIPIVCGAIKAVRGRRGMMQKVELDTGETLKAEFMFSRQNRAPNAGLAAALGAVIEGEGHIKVDALQRTSVPMVYAAGDVCHANNHQLISAAHQGATAALSANEDMAGPMEKPW